MKRNLQNLSISFGLLNYSTILIEILWFEMISMAIASKSVNFHGLGLRFLQICVSFEQLLNSFGISKF